MYNMTDKERAMLLHCNYLVEKMDWKPINIVRVKITAMQNYAGLNLEDAYSDRQFILLSSVHNMKSRDMYATLLHELVHAHLRTSPKHVGIAHKHGKIFKRAAAKLAKRISFPLDEIIGI